MSSGYKPKDRVEISKFDIPFSLLKNEPHIEMFGNSKMNFEGTYTILEYNDMCLKLKTKNKTLFVQGSELYIVRLDSDFISLIGKIKMFEYI